MKRRIPRKLKKKIPKGLYCYQLVSFDRNTCKSKIKPCVFYTSIKCKEKPIHLQNEIDLEFPEEYIGWCKLIKYEIDDQCKSCGIRRKF